MDLYAYTKIEDLEHLLNENNIKIPRLRGLRLMKEEEIIPEEDIIERIEIEKKDYLINWLRQRSDCIWCSSKMNKTHKAFIYGKNKEGKKEVVGFDFTKVHGKARKHIKLRWKRIEKLYRKQFETFNKYAGKDVLYVHARLGSTNWSDYTIDQSHPLFLDKVDDAFDTSYCDIYYKLNEGAIE